MKTITLGVYTLEELTPDAKARALDTLRKDWSGTLPDGEVLNDTIKYAVAKHFADIEPYRVYYSLNYAQGDGVSFDLDATEWAHEWLTSQGYTDFEAEASVRQASHQYYHYNTMNCETRVCIGDEDRDDLADQMHEDLLNAVRDASREAERAGYAEIDHAQSDEYVTELIEANDLRFFVDGTRQFAL